MTTSKIEQAEFHLENLLTSIDKFTYPRLDETEVTPQDRLVLNKIKEMLDVKKTQIQTRYEKAQEEYEKAGETIAEMESFVNNLDNAIENVEDALSQ